MDEGNSTSAGGGRFLLAKALDSEYSHSFTPSALIQSYVEAGTSLVGETGTCFDILIFEDDFDQRNSVAEEAKQNLELVQRCLSRTAELASEMNTANNETFTTITSSNEASAPSSATSSPSQSIKKNSLRKTRGSVQADLLAARKQHEKAHLAKIIARQRQQQQESAAVVKPKSVDLQFVSDLLSKRQSAHSSFNERLFSLFEGFASARTDEDIWQRTLKLSFSTAPAGLEPNNSIVGLMSHPSHPISRLVRDFVIRMRHLLNDEVEPAISQLLPEYHQFCCQLVKLLKHNYAEELTDSAFEMQLYVSIESFFFAHLPSLASTIAQHFKQVNQSADTEVLKKCVELAWVEFDSELALFEVLGVREKHRLSASSFDSTISELRKLQSLTTPTSKANSLLRACDLICAALEEEAGGDALIGSEDLVLLLSYALVRAQVFDISAQFAFVSELLPEPLLRGQAGYVLATLQTCIDFISSIK